MRCGVEVQEASATFRIVAPGGFMCSRQVVIDAPLLIQDDIYSSTLIVLDDLGVDVILGMNWLAKQEAVIDCVFRVITMKNSSGDKVQLSPGITSTPKSSRTMRVDE